MSIIYSFVAKQCSRGFGNRFDTPLWEACVSKLEKKQTLPSLNITQKSIANIKSEPITLNIIII
jgi:hypothetical protein